METRTLKIAYPEELPARMGKTPEEFEQEMRFLMAARLYELGLISSGRGSDLAGLDRVAFLNALGQYRISIFNYSREELEREIQEARDRVEKRS